MVANILFTENDDFTYEQTWLSVASTLTNKIVSIETI